MSDTEDPVSVRIGVFDLDGTLVPHDTFKSFLRAHLRRSPSRLVAARRGEWLPNAESRR